MDKQAGTFKWQMALTKPFEPPWQKQQNGMCAQQRLWSACSSAQSDQSSLHSMGSFLHADSEDSDQTG